MRPHHRKVVDRLVDLFAPDPHYIALLVGGSIARGWDREDSDVDIILIATDAEYARRAPANALHYWNQEMADYPGGYVDGKIVDWAFLEDVAERGAEPARAAFVGATIAFSKRDGLEQLIKRICTYPEGEHTAKLESFYAQLEAMRWYMGEADKRQDRYLACHVAAELVLFGGRMILAHNRILYPYHKWLMRVLQDAPDRPADLMDRINTLLMQPCAATASAFADTVVRFADWPRPAEGWGARFMHDSEWAWRRGAAPLADR
ncbi:MAG TPA: nucleotidyltransferase domain-containing protein [Symbiobacteriaceae bacterium]|nr:nucleotidyltransferase domain-containing protein [Symbiobacteriaceae bacterium]